ncbi:DUF6968 family protein [Sorangium sp. So ce1078]|uniref:DUF6968 family protein n=1 Tax=Sorangium sp. So ce1078 TaxID=3133329 RepID=UPI003F643AC8
MKKNLGERRLNFTPPGGQAEVVVARFGYPYQADDGMWWVDWQVIGAENPGTVRKAGGTDAAHAIVSAMNCLDTELGSLAMRGALDLDGEPDRWRFIPKDLFCLQ